MAREPSSKPPGSNEGKAVGRITWVCTLALAAAVGACGDPVIDDQKAALGGERGVRAGPTHRPGQPCTVCHNGKDQSEFSVAGTVYDTILANRPVQGARVEFKDPTGATFVVETNCAGNFFVRPSTYKPLWPLLITVSYGTQVQKMESVVHREAACATCHGLQTSPSSAGPVYLWPDTVPDGVPGGCR